MKRKPQIPETLSALAAEYIAAMGYTWSKALRSIKDFYGTAPSPEEVEHEIRRWYDFYEPKSHTEMLFMKRRAAFRLMQRAPGLDLRLIGTVLNGAATYESLTELVTRTEGEKETLMTLLSAGITPEPFDEPYPTAFVRRMKKLRKDVVSVLVEDLETGEPLLIRIAPEHAPLPPAQTPDEWQLPWEAAGSLNSEALDEMLSYPYWISPKPHRR